MENFSPAKFNMNINNKDLIVIIVILRKLTNQSKRLKPSNNKLIDYKTKEDTILLK